MAQQFGDPLTVHHVGLRPGTALICWALASTIWKCSSSTFQTGFQYTPVDSMATCRTLKLLSHSANSRRSRVVQPKRRRCFCGLCVCSSRIHTATDVGRTGSLAWNRLLGLLPSHRQVLRMSAAWMAQSTHWLKIEAGPQGHLASPEYREILLI